MKKRIYCMMMFALLFIGAMSVNAQVTIGSQSEPHKAAVLDLKSETKGLFMPRVFLSNVSVFSLDESGADTKATAAGIVVYNTNESIAGGSGTGVYVWDGSKWMIVGEGSIPSNKTIQVKAITITGQASVNVGSSINLSAAVSPSNASNKTIIWSVSNSSGKATIDVLSGVLTGVESGTVYVYATAMDGSGISSMYKVTVNPVYVTGINIVGSSTVFAGSSIILDAEVIPSNATNKNVLWSVTNGTGSAIIDATRGILLGVSSGTVTVIATAQDGSGKSALKTITVETTNIPVSGITIGGLTSVKVNENITFTATVSPSNASNTGVTWSVTNGTGSAMINSATGMLTGQTAGTVTVKATAQDGSGVISNSIVVTVTTTSMTEITISGAEDLASESSTTLTATVYPSNTVNKDITWSVDKTSIATISNTGVLTGVGTGLVTVTATSVENPAVLATKQVVVYPKGFKAVKSAGYDPIYGTTYLDMPSGSGSSVFLNYFQKTNKTLYVYTVMGYSKHTEALTYANAIGCRLPNLAEAYALMEYGIFNNPKRQFHTSDMASDYLDWRIDYTTLKAQAMLNDYRDIYMGVVCVFVY